MEQGPTPSLTEHLIRYKPQIEAALKHADNSYTFDQIVHGVLSGKLRFFPNGDSFALMEIHTYPNWRSFHCFLAGGKLSEILELQPLMLEHGKELGCKRLTLTGRRGFGRVLKKHGWELSHVQMSHPIT